MYRWQYLVKPLASVATIVVLPMVAFLILMVRFFPQQSFWAWFFLIVTECGVWIAFLAGVAQLTGSSLSQWVGWDVFEILNAFEKTTRRTLSSVQDTLPVLNRRLERSEVSEVWDHLGQGRPVLIEGESGSGKSGIAAEIVRQANRRRIPTLFLNARNFSSAVVSFTDLAHYVGVYPPLRDCLEKLSHHVGKCLLVIDQLDSVVGTPSYQISTELLAAAKTLNNVMVVAVSCILDSSEYQAIRDLAFNVVASHLLDRPRVVELLREMQITKPSDALVMLSENLFYLSMAAELAEEAGIAEVEGKVALLEKYRTTLERLEGAEVIQRIVDLAYENLDVGKSNFTLPRVQDRPVKRLQNRGLIVAVGYGLYGFRHEQLLYYFYAQGAIDRAVPPARILEGIAGHRASSALVWVLRLYRQRRANELAEYLHEALITSDRVGFYEQAALLDELHTWENIVEYATTLEVVLEMLQSRPDLRNYFFRSGPSAAWAHILWEHGFFATPPEPQKTEQGVMLPRWDVQDYLVTVASQVPDIVVKHVKSVTGPSWYKSQAIRAICYVSAERAETAVLKIAEWLADPALVTAIAGEASELLLLLARNSRTKAAFSLFRALIAPFPPADLKAISFAIGIPANPGLDKVLEGQRGAPSAFDLLKNLDIQQLVSILEDNLRAVLKIEAGAAQTPEYENSSWWRAAIEDTDQDRNDSCKDKLLSALRDALETWVQKDARTAETLVQQYLNESLGILRRLGLHILHSYPANYPELVVSELGKEANLSDVDIHHELFLLLQRGYRYLTPADQDILVRSIINGPPPEQVEELTTWAHTNRGIDPEEYAQRYTKSWTRDRLWMLRDGLTGQPKEFLDRLVAEEGVPEHPSFTRWTSSFSVQEVGPLTDQQLSEMPPDVLTQFVKEWQVSPERGLGPQHVSYVGLAGEVAGVIAADPYKYADHLIDIGTHRPEYAYATLSRFANAKEVTSIPWQLLIGLSEKLLADDAIRQDMSRTFERSWIAVRLAIVRLLEVGFKNPERAISLDCLSRARDILLALVDDPDPELADDRPPEGWAGHNDPATVALNHVRPSALAALIDYALFNAKLVEKKKNVASQDHGVGRLEPIVR